ncbi:SusC/RagA family TonB-linked outer membrane protein [Croceimicrobium hydrocarbonivorans]|uniref:TonB-dependent receptor n=1 Tax=Croceimicrobium hydrocarbonivorans TaxID=2761580 RepID=A0A7H0VD69_9FLAO|nr:TonB-dependent receptor [Croceimicrobium hydrocarbonivorans]QNR23667.1 TonB-dependent receptor [Croceimicrobium hydrocarbonivorans]
MDFTPYPFGIGRRLPVPKSSISFLLLLLFFSGGKVFGQNKGLEQMLAIKDASIKSCLEQIEAQSDYVFSYSADLKLDQIQVDFPQEAMKLSDCLEHLSAKHQLSFQIIGKNISVKQKNKSAEDPVKSSQIIKATGYIYDDQGLPLPGANIQSLDGRYGSATNALGYFSFNLTSDVDSLEVSFIGLQNQRFALDSQEVKLWMTAVNSDLDEVVVVGYRKQKRINLTTSVASVGSEELAKHEVPSLDQALIGRMAGVEVIQPTGDPGSSASFRIRGLKSIGAGSQPLIVVDGQPISDQSGIASLNPADISRVDVLKDAAATAIYGSRGANGVVLISTKSGKEGPTKFNFSVTQSYQSVLKQVELLDAYDFADSRNQAYRNSWIQQNPGQPVPTDPRDYGIPDYMLPYLEGKSGLTNTNWQDEIFQLAPMSRYNLSASGNSAGLLYFLSANYLKQEGLVKGSDYERFSFRSNFEGKFKSWLSYGLKLNPSYAIKNEVSSENYSDDGVVLIAQVADPFFPVREANGDLVLGGIYPETVGGPVENPVALATQIEDKTEEIRLIANTYLEIEPIRNLKIKTLLGTDLISRKYTYYRPSNLGQYRSAPPVSAVGKFQARRILNWVSENTLNYDFDWGAHQFNFLGGITAQSESAERGWMNGRGFPNDETFNINIADEINAGNNIDEWTLMSYLARLMYEFDNRYLLSASLRSDGSSRFGSNSRWGTFPSFSAAWRLSSEKFFPKLNWLNQLKFRGSIGETGNFSIPNYGSISLLGDYNYVFNNDRSLGIAPYTNPNVNLTWETTVMQDYGLDLNLFSNQLELSLDYYISNTSGMLLDVPVPAHSGFVSSLSNLGKSQNKGWDISLLHSYERKSFQWTNRLNFSTNKNKIIALGPGQEYLRTWYTSTEVGGELSAYWGYRSLGVLSQEDIEQGYPVRSDAMPGFTYRWEDVNGDGEITEEDKTILGSYFPDYTWSLASSLNYKNFDFSFLMQSVQGHEIFNYTRLWTTNPENWSPVLKEVYNNPDYVKPLKNQTDKNYQRSSVLIEDGSYIRIKNITLGYSLSKALLESLNLSNLRLYFSMENPFMFTDYTGTNPEVSSRNSNSLQLGIDYGNYPIARIFSMGANLSF